MTVRRRVTEHAFAFRCSEERNDALGALGRQRAAQGLGHHRGREAAAPELRQPMLYKLVRHPLYSGFFLAFWSTPHMTAGHLLLALGMSVYMLVAIQYEERDLVGLFGKQYEDYRARVGMLTPRLRR